jgi:hypothetical protein
VGDIKAALENASGLCLKNQIEMHLFIEQIMPQSMNVKFRDKLQFHKYHPNRRPSIKSEVSSPVAGTLLSSNFQSSAVGLVLGLWAFGLWAFGLWALGKKYPKPVILALSSQLNQRLVNYEMPVFQICRILSGGSRKVTIANRNSDGNELELNEKFAEDQDGIRLKKK